MNVLIVAEVKPSKFSISLDPSGTLNPHTHSVPGATKAYQDWLTPKIHKGAKRHLGAEASVKECSHSSVFYTSADTVYQICALFANEFLISAGAVFVLSSGERSRAGVL